MSQLFQALPEMIKLKLSTGRDIQLTKREYLELINRVSRETKEIPALLKPKVQP